MALFDPPSYCSSKYDIPQNASSGSDTSSEDWDSGFMVSHSALLVTYILAFSCCLLCCMFLFLVLEVGGNGNPGMPPSSGGPPPPGKVWVSLAALNDLTMQS